MAYKTIITLPGYDVATATPEQCSIHSDYESIKLATDKSPEHFGTLNYTFTSEPSSGITNIFSIDHGCSYIPMVMAYTFVHSQSGGDDIYSMFRLPTYFNWYYCAFMCTSDSTHMKIDFWMEPASLLFPPPQPTMTGLSYDFKYYIFVEQASS